MQEFFINKNSLLNPLRLKLIQDGRHNYTDFFNNLQDCEIYFTMVDVETGITKIAHQEGMIIDNNDCEGTMDIGYQWKERDINKVGRYRGQFEIIFNGNLNKNYQNKNLIVPIREELIINVNEGVIKK